MDPEFLLTFSNPSATGGFIANKGQVMRRRNHRGSGRKPLTGLGRRRPDRLCRNCVFDGHITGRG
jgi:hypothetical protein